MVYMECTRSVGMVGGTDSVGSVVCTQQVGKAEETQSVGSAVHPQLAGLAICTFNKVSVFTNLLRSTECPQSMGSMECTQSVGMVEDKQPGVMVVCTPLDGMAVHAVHRVGCACTVGGVGGACRKSACSVVRTVRGAVVHAQLEVLVFCTQTGVFSGAHCLQG